MTIQQKYDQLADRVKAMRHAQKAYYNSHKDQDKLRKAKALEHDVDVLLERDAQEKKLVQTKLF